MIIEQIVSQHAEESAFLWLLRDQAVRAPHYTLEDIAALEQRIQAHLDGLRVAGTAAWSLCEEGLQQAEAGEVFAAACLALEASEEAWLSRVLETVVAAPESIRGLVSALGWVPKQRLQGLVVHWLESQESLYRLLGISACAIQRVDCGAYLQHALDDPEPGIRARALRSVGEIGRLDLLPTLGEHLEDEDGASRFWAAWSSTLLGSGDGIQVLQRQVEEAGDRKGAALAIVLRAMEREAAMRGVGSLSGDAAFQRLVVQAAGIIGDPVTVPWLIHQMETPALARVAGESFSLITGVDIAYQDLEGDWPDGFEAGPTERAEDEDVAMDPDEDLPWPDPAATAAWWSEHHDRYPAGQRLLCGRPVSPGVCVEVLQQGYQRQRRAAALELALSSPDRALFNTSAPAWKQQRSPQ